MDLPNKPQKPFAGTQLAAWRAFRELLKNTDQSDRLYNGLNESQNGRVISTDIARSLDVEYSKMPPCSLRDLDPGDDLAWRYSWDRMEREISKRGRRKLVRFMAGGWAAGKTHAIEHLATMPDLVWDGTLKDTEWAVKMIDLALHHGWTVEITYVYRNLELAFTGASLRAKSEGRAVPLDKLPAIHRAVQLSVRDLITLYRLETTRVTFLLLHNIGTRDIPMKPLNFMDTDLEPDGGLHYNPSHEAYYTQAAAHFPKT